METLPATTTGVLTLNPACFTTTNLWMDELCTRPAYGSGRCTRYNLGADCSIRVEDRVALSDCPVGMTPAWSFTGTELQDVSLATSYCCPTGFDFSVSTTSWPGGGTLRATCLAESIEQLSGQTITLSQATYRVETSVRSTVTVRATTTTAAYDYEEDKVFAEAATIWKYIYPGAETTSTCYGIACNPSNPLPQAPEKTPPPSTFTYTPPPPFPATQFTPDPSCLAESNFWQVSTYCWMEWPNPSPDWLRCTHTGFGEPNTYLHPECFPSATVPPQEAKNPDIKTWYSECPVGYSVAKTFTTGPFNLPTYVFSEPSPTKTYDVTATGLACCPSGKYHFEYRRVDTSVTVRNGVPNTVSLYIMPSCIATKVSALSGKGIAMKEWYNTAVYDKKRDLLEGRQANHDAEATITDAWDMDNTLYAQAIHLGYTVFQDRYTCYDDYPNTYCADYFSGWFRDNVPNTYKTWSPPTTTTTTTTSSDGSSPTGDGSNGGDGDGDGGENGEEVVSSSSLAGAEQVGRSGTIMITLVTVVTVVMGLSA
ncbi:hypothetical protein QBC41DRAFT_238553 [Cercophora samala]|uniref:Uncharacterized protein n=1 Tax=Cercophora samala TaxID=330535 RepID=A0AA39YJN9_9PEZI|nr:hypothetical protein QBC41DRAFT_238553 [Cercophora samala]